MPDPKRVRQSDIAERVGLTKVSVSKALRDHPDISEATREKVKRVAREMGYVPNRVARSLTSSQSKTLGVVIPKVTHSFFAEVLDGIHEAAAARGYEIVLTVSQERAEAERRHLQTLLAMQVDGLLVSVSEEEPDRAVYERVRKRGVPLVFFDRAPELGLGFLSVTVDDQGGARQIVEHVIAQGRRRVAHVAGHAHTNIGRERQAGYEEALEARGRPVREEWIAEGGFDEESGYAGAKQVLEGEPLPDAIFAVTFPVGLGVLDALREQRPALEDQIQIAVFGNQQLNRYLRPPFLCVAQPARALGERATELLFEQIQSGRTDGEAEPQQVVLPTRVAGGREATDASIPERTGFIGSESSVKK